MPPKVLAEPPNDFIKAWRASTLGSAAIALVANPPIKAAPRAKDINLIFILVSNIGEFVAA
jgi:hypothetical protein